MCTHFNVMMITLACMSIKNIVISIFGTAEPAIPLCAKVCVNSVIDSNIQKKKKHELVSHQSIGFKRSSKKKIYKKKKTKTHNEITKISNVVNVTLQTSA